jgi:hypothetical protein
MANTSPENFPEPEHGMRIIPFGDRAVTTGKDAAQYLGVHPNTIRRWANTGILTAIQLPSGTKRFTVDGILSMREQMEGALPDVADLRRPETVEALRQFVMGHITAEEAGRGFGYSGLLPKVTVKSEFFTLLSSDK